MPGLFGTPSGEWTEDNLDCLLDRGMGSEVPNEFLDPLLSFMEGERLRLCMYASASEMEDREAGTSIAFRPWPSTGMAKVAPWLPTGWPAVLLEVRWWAAEDFGLMGGD
jgi:hypothetical protein